MFVRIWIIGWMVLGTSDSVVYKIQTENSSGRENETRDDTVVAKPDVNYGWVWSEWSEWSACSRTCGGGVKSQTRRCLGNRTITTEVSKVSPENQHKKKAHKIHKKCIGISKRSQLCNKEECPKDTKDFRTIQCEYYNKKAFAGQYYSWQAYYDDKNQCSLNCRPFGFEFYARLNNTVIDGTPCKTPKSEAGVCIGGKCQFVGCDGVIGGQRYDVCGVCGGDNSTCRLISGLYTRPHLVSGYNYIAEIPQYACNLSISEVKKTNNLIALRYKNGTYVLNGEWLQSPTGSFDSAGTKFTYVRGSNNIGDSISASGPLLQPLELLLLYRQINPGIKYEYMMPLQSPLRELSSQNSLDNYNYYNEAAEQKKNEEQERYKKYVTGEVSGYGGISAESQGLIRDEEAKPRGKNKKKRFSWKITGYTPCSKTCGMGTQIPIYSCVKENNPQQTVAEKRCVGIEKPDKQPIRCNAKPCAAEWVVSNWSECSVTCGEGVETREVLCKQEISPSLTVTVAEEACLTTPSPNLLRTRPCFRKSCGESSSSFKAYWKTGPWSMCSSKCGAGVKTRSVQCVSEQDDECPEDEKPTDEMICDMGPCNVVGTYAWYSTEWTQQCSESCGVGTQTRRIYCSAGAQLESFCDKSTKPESARNCSNNEQCSGRWFSSPWSQCSTECGWGKQYRTSVCLAFSIDTNNYTITAEFNCKEKDRPVEDQACFVKPCNSQWFSGAWSTCSRSCDSGIQRREVRCLNEDLQPATDCQEADKPTTRRTCNTQKCSIYLNQEPDNIIESTTENTSQKINSRYPGISNSECQDKINTCHLVAQARLCNYKYYQSLCCVSCYSFYHSLTNNSSLVSNNINA